MIRYQCHYKLDMKYPDGEKGKTIYKEKLIVEASSPLEFLQKFAEIVDKDLEEHLMDNFSLEVRNLSILQ